VVLRKAKRRTSWLKDETKLEKTVKRAKTWVSYKRIGGDIVLQGKQKKGRWTKDGGKSWGKGGKGKKLNRKSGGDKDCHNRKVVTGGERVFTITESKHATGHNGGYKVQR